MDRLKGKFSGKVIILGKGQSLEFIKKEDFDDVPIIALNSSIIQLEKLNLSNDIYSMQRNYGVTVPKRAKLLLHDPLSKDFCKDTKLERYFFNEKLLGLPEQTPTALCAIKAAKFMGFTKIIMKCFDACTNGDMRTYGKGELEIPLEGYNDYLVLCCRLKEYDVEFI